ncbi:high-affinity lysophosphatidic acid receptor-like [Lytechinus variegatus]|uniref:high-affinity lysophosphatidic acid receptor-like n=1 Tax=Lytechinus variegatus TaxID=7654 RepID=UPI001BB29BDB|nr:high-affinity lysophosphatidic acid receptor-like [Lytechinus variegatus]
MLFQGWIFKSKSLVLKSFQVRSVPVHLHPVTMETTTTAITTALSSAVISTQPTSWEQWELTCNNTDVSLMPLNNGSNVTLAEPPMGLGAVVIFSFLMVLMIMIAVLGNCIVCLIVYQKPAMRSAINLLLANLAFADIMVAVTCMPFALIALVLGEWILGDIMCKITAFLYFLFITEATFILATISVDRYFIIVHRKDKLNPHRAKLLILLSWFCSFVVAFPPIIGWGKYAFPRGPGPPQCWVEMDLSSDKVYYIMLMLAVFFIPFTAMLFSYFFILNTVRRNSLRIQNHPESLSISQATKLGLAGLHRPSRVNVDMSFKTRAFTTILLLFIVFVVCWAPYAISGLVYHFSSWTGGNVMHTIVLWLTYLNSAFNPIIYCWRIKKFREACRELAPKTFKLLPHLPGRTRRRIRPSAMYECNQQSSV